MQTRTEKPITDNKVIQEMISTEKTYNQALALLELALTIEVNVANNPLLIAFKKQVSALKNISDKLLENVESAVAINISDLELNTLRLQRTQLLTAFFEAYKQYAPLFDQYTVQFKSNPNQFSIIDRYLSTYSPKLGLADHLIMPVQRGPRYSMLVNATQKINVHLEERNKAEFERLNTLISEFLVSTNTSMSATTSSPSKATGYRFGDGTRYVLGLFGKSTPPAESITITAPDMAQTGNPSTKRLSLRSTELAHAISIELPDSQDSEEDVDNDFNLQ